MHLAMGGTKSGTCYEELLSPLKRTTSFTRIDMPLLFTPSFPLLPPCARARMQLFAPTWALPLDARIKARQELLAGKAKDKLNDLSKFVVSTVQA